MAEARIRGHAWLWLLLATWAAAVGAGFFGLVRYHSQPGAPALAPASIPQSAPKPQLLVFLHPECPCSAATVSELERIAARSQDRLVVQAYVLAPSHPPTNWDGRSLLNHLETVHNVTANLDQDGHTAKSFGVDTSGQVLLYSATGKLVFSGGITASRGHEGDNDGSDAILAYLDHGRVPQITTPVFGCSLGLRSQEDNSK